MAHDPENNPQPGDLKFDLWRKILCRLQRHGIGNGVAVDECNCVCGDSVTILQRKVLQQLDP